PRHPRSVLLGRLRRRRRLALTAARRLDPFPLSPASGERVGVRGTPGPRPPRYPTAQSGPPDAWRGASEERVQPGSLDVAIVGGGIGGLALASALVQRGIVPRVYEQARALAEVGAGVALAPNGIRLLRRLGFADRIERLGARWAATEYRRADGTPVG